MRGDDLLGRRREAVRRSPCGRASRNISGPYAASRPLRSQSSSGWAIGSEHLLGAGRVHLLADDLLDLAQHPVAERQPGVDAGRDPADVAGPDEQPVAVDLGVGRVVAQRAQEQRATSAWPARLPTRHAPSAVRSRRRARYRRMSIEIDRTNVDHAGRRIFPTSRAGISARNRATVCGRDLEFRGAASISMGRTPHEVHDELCRAARQLTPPAHADPLARPAASRPAPRPGSRRMAIDVRELASPTPRPESSPRSSTSSSAPSREYLDGRVDEDVFRVFRLNQGIYGQRQGGHNQMLRVKIPHGRVTPEQLEMFALHRRDLLARLGPPHHPPERAVPLRPARADARGPAPARRRSASPSREACGDTVRNVMGCHLAGACPLRGARHHAVGRGDHRPASCATRIAQRLPRKFKINFSGCATDCGQAMFNDVGVIARHPPAAPTARSSPASRCSSPAASAPTRTRRRRSRSSRAARTCCRRSRRCLRTFDHYGNRDNKLRARMKWLVDTMGIDELRERIVKERKFLRASAHAGRAASPSRSRERGDAPRAARRGTEVGADGGVPVEAAVEPTRTTAGRRPTSCAAAPTARSARSRTARLGDITTDQFRGLADIQRDFDARRPHHQPPELRAARPHRGPSSAALYDRLAEIDMAEPGAELARDVVALPRRRHLQPRGHAVARPRRRHRRRARRGRPRRGRRRARQHLRLHELAAASTTSPTSASSGSSGGRTAGPRPATRCCSAVTSATWRSSSARRPTKLPAKRRAEAVVRVVGRFAGERGRRRDVRRRGSTRSGGAAGVGATLKDLDVFPDARRGARLLRRLRRDRSVRRRGRRQRVRDMSALDRPERPSTPVDAVTRRGRARATRRPRRARRQSRPSSSTAPATAAIEWAWERFGTDVVLAASFQDCVLIDVAVQVVPDIEVVFLDTQYHFAETLWYVEQVRERYDLNLTVMQPLVAPDDLWQTDPDECCASAQGRAARPRARRQGRRG